MSHDLPPQCLCSPQVYQDKHKTCLHGASTCQPHCAAFWQPTLCMSTCVTSLGMKSKVFFPHVTNPIPLSRPWLWTYQTFGFPWSHSWCLARSRLHMLLADESTGVHFSKGTQATKSFGALFKLIFWGTNHKFGRHVSVTAYLFLLNNVAATE